MAIVGDLQEFSLPDLLQLIEKGSKTGQLSVWAPNGIYKIWFYQGRVIAALPPEEEHRLEGLLARSGLVSERVVEKLASFCGPEEPLGRCLQRQGLISPVALAKLFRHQLQVGLYSLFALEAGQFSFLPSVRLPYREMTGLSKGASAVVLEALQQLKLDQRPEESLPQPDSYFWRTSSELPLYRLSPLEWGVLEGVSPSRNLAELARALGADLLEVRYACARLAKLGLISPCDGPTAIVPSLLVSDKLTAVAESLEAAKEKPSTKLPSFSQGSDRVKPSLVSRLATLLRGVRDK
ncbi:hypothetical protein SYN63AY4M2_07315 [Synechococcus sp. 63AY4M2]|jgi:hypothetical protein|uniref:DUF4388 domain-containing protein n=1 Tax=unclassified Synechococcus TaxID=2626047 RepID=UPI0000694949|nr:MULTISPECIES: DUF4388 domain-containing protein [unclassified Synechococcus]ABD00968.1 conserved hypothetical protein [Synechococcus sp. JA-3-3Ab]PIK86268.1 hypothetical protein SYN63AY4M2_07315 [Synechococcus sp. 63AY4M2]PIK89507.1 hypothetical protein SYN65AY6A5_11020 [Synechococcus sp. 65AY6A5]PIK91625.1 hypothetical protein SYN65AY6LI_04785 [Synechococcus sp. 65AY6Li]PIK95335.1 hypothetical protein SYN60AY4M2_07910 [Synechococcus sp. 60AY4M2]